MKCRALSFMACVAWSSVALAQTLPSTQPTYVWWEAEKPARTNIPLRGNAFAPMNDDEASKLSGGAWIGTGANRAAPAFLEYVVDVPADGKWSLYARKFWKHGPYRWRFDGGAWTSIDKQPALLDDTPIRTNVVANWTLAGTAELKAGPHRLRIESTENAGPIVFDCFLLTQQPFTPRGKMKPDEKYDVTEPGWSAFQPDADAPSPIDLRFLNEPLAGSEGPIVARDGRFVHSTSGKPVRFWGVNAPPNVTTLGDAQLDALAKSLARRGVNLVRLHGAVFFTDGPNKGKPNPRYIERVQYAVSAFKREGIYTTLSIYYPLWLELDASEGWSGYKKKHPFGVLFWDERFQSMYRDWWRAVLTSDNPHGPKLASEPAILSCEVLNEDSLFFWTFKPYDSVPAEMMPTLEKRFGDWLTKKYGSIDAAITAWKSNAETGDAPTEGRVGIVIPWRLFNFRDARSRDTTAFLAEVERSFYESTSKFLKTDLGLQSMVSGSNWTTASDQYLTPVERWANASLDFVDRHGYHDALLEGEGAGWSVRPGQTYADRSIVRGDPAKPGGAIALHSPIQDVQYDDKPTMLSEVGWPSPNRFDGEMAPFCAVYGALQDLDAIAFFAVNGPGWQSSIGKFSVQTPTQLGAFPAAALIYRQGLIDEGKPAVETTASVQALLNVEGLPSTDARLSYAGPRRVHYASEANSSATSLDASTLVLDAEKRIVSNTGQIDWRYGDGALRINAPRARRCRLHAEGRARCARRCDDRLPQRVRRGAARAARRPADRDLEAAAASNDHGAAPARLAGVGRAAANDPVARQCAADAAQCRRDRSTEASRCQAATRDAADAKRQRNGAEQRRRGDDRAEAERDVLRDRDAVGHPHDDSRSRCRRTAPASTARYLPSP
ncbi:MAG: hypothetical protein QM770_16460 [Tepidisphaeraceae bacterium]